MPEKKQFNSNIKFNYVQGNSLNLSLHDSGYFAFHYALKHNFLIESVSQKQTFKVLEGSFFLAKNTNSYNIKSNNESTCKIITILLDKNFLISEIHRLTGSRSYFISFMYDLAFNYAIPDSSHRFNPLNRMLNEVLYDLIDKQSYPGPVNQEFLQLVIKEFIIYLDYNFENNKIAPLPLTMEIIEYIHNNLDTANLIDISNHYKLSSSRFSEIVYDITGYRFSEMLHSEKMSKSLELLATTNETIAEVSEHLGYMNASSFTTAFINRYNETPSQYRKSLKEKK